MSYFGAEITAVALPLVALLTLSATSGEIGILRACVFLPFLGVPLLAGVFVDRHRKRPVMLTANAVRALLIAAVPTLWWLELLTLKQLYAIALLTGVFAVLFEVAQMAYVPSLVGRDRLADGNARLLSSYSAATLAGPGIGGVLVQAVGAPLTLLVDAISYLVSVVSIALVRLREAAPAASERRPHQWWGEIVEGLRAVYQNRPVRLIAIQGLLSNLFNQVLEVAFLIYALRERDTGAGAYGIVLAAGGAGAVVGSIVTPKLTRRFGFGPVFLGAVIVDTTVLLLVPLAEGSIAVLVGIWMFAFALNGFGTGIANVVSYTLRQSLTPDHVLGRMSASMRLVLYAGIPIGALVGGILSATIGAQETLYVDVAGLILSIPVVLPFRRLVSTD